MLDGYIKVFLCAHAVSRLQVSICGCSAWARVCARGWGTCKGLVVGLVLSAARGTLTSWIRRRRGKHLFLYGERKNPEPTRSSLGPRLFLQAHFTKDVLGQMCLQVSLFLAISAFMHGFVPLRRARARR